MDDKKHFMDCPKCGKKIDKRDLGQVMAHNLLNDDAPCADQDIDTGYSTSRRLGDNVQWTNEKKPLNLN